MAKEKLNAPLSSLLKLMASYLSSLMVHIICPYQMKMALPRLVVLSK